MHAEVGQQVAKQDEEDGDTECPAMYPLLYGIMVNEIRSDEIKYGTEKCKIVHQGREQHEAQRFLERFLLPIGTA